MLKFIQIQKKKGGDNMEEKMEILLQKMDKFESKLNHIEEKVDCLEGKVDDVQEEINDIHQEIREVKEQQFLFEHEYGNKIHAIFDSVSLEMDKI